jgi:transcriptional regulator with XRE-family HTH domain
MYKAKESLNMFGLFPSSFEEELKNLIIEHRKKSNLSQSDLAIFSGVSRTAIQRLEQGNLTIQMDTLLKILKILNIQLYLKGPLSDQQASSFSLSSLTIITKIGEDK